MNNMKVNICGVPHTVVECEDKFNVDTHFGQKYGHEHEQGCKQDNVSGREVYVEYRKRYNHHACVLLSFLMRVRILCPLVRS